MLFSAPRLSSTPHPPQNAYESRGRTCMQNMHARHHVPVHSSLYAHNTGDSRGLVCPRWLLHLRICVQPRPSFFNHLHSSTHAASTKHVALPAAKFGSQEYSCFFLLVPSSARRSVANQVFKVGNAMCVFCDTTLSGHPPIQWPGDETGARSISSFPAPGCVLVAHPFSHLPCGAFPDLQLTI